MYVLIMMDRLDDHPLITIGPFGSMEEAKIYIEKHVILKKNRLHIEEVIPK